MLADPSNLQAAGDAVRGVISMLWSMLSSGWGVFWLVLFAAFGGAMTKAPPGNYSNGVPSPRSVWRSMSGRKNYH